MELEKLIQFAIKNRATSLHVKAGQMTQLGLAGGRLQPVNLPVPDRAAVARLATEAVSLPARQGAFKVTFTTTDGAIEAVLTPG